MSTTVTRAQQGNAAADATSTAAFGEFADSAAQAATQGRGIDSTNLVSETTQGAMADIAAKNSMGQDMMKLQSDMTFLNAIATAEKDATKAAADMVKSGQAG
jgi:hypothetical protein